MKNRTGAGRSNFFRVKKPDLFQFVLSQLNVQAHVISDNQGAPTFCIDGDSKTGDMVGYVSFEDNLSGVEVDIKSDSFVGNVFIKIKNFDWYSLAEKSDQPYADSKKKVLDQYVNNLIHLYIPDAETTIVSYNTESFIDTYNFDLQSIIVSHLKENSVMVFFSVSHQEEKPISGKAKAVSSKGIVELSLSKIYEIAEKELGISQDKIPVC